MTEQSKIIPDEIYGVISSLMSETLNNNILAFCYSQEMVRKHIDDTFLTAKSMCVLYVGDHLTDEIMSQKNFSQAILAPLTVTLLENDFSLKSSQDNKVENVSNSYARGSLDFLEPYKQLLARYKKLSTL